MTNPNLLPRDTDPEWLALLRAKARATSIQAAADVIGMKRPSVSLLLSGTYPGGTGPAEARVLAALKGRVVCAALGEIDSATCAEWAAKPYSASSSHRVAMYQACRACCNRPRNGESPC